ncbi:MAG: amino acid permease [Lachnospiraceae bacterium]|nr:amino acid permease [Lachnospiraceae bacterium]
MENTGLEENSRQRRLEQYLSPLSVWALSFGCAVGWGSFVMPGTTFLPGAGPVGTAAGMLIGAVVMLIIGMNYHYLMNKYPDAGGTLTYTIRTFGYDHGFLSAWFLALVYEAIIWANASALGLISKNLFGTTFQFGFHYTILGYDVYLGEVLLSVAAILICGGICVRGKKLAASLQILFALLLIGGVIACAAAVLASGAFLTDVSIPAFSQNGKSGISQIFTIVALSPWAFVGFESVSNSAEGFKFPVRKTKWIFAASLFTGMIVYVLLTEMSVLVIPEGYADWTGYIADLGSHSGIEGLPTFHSIHAVAGRLGTTVLCVAAFAGIVTGLIGNFIAGSRLLYTMAEDDILPAWFGKLNKDSSPGNALLFLMGISVFIPFLGRTAIGWIVDVNTVGATIAYAYTSADAYAAAYRENNKKMQLTGIIGIVMSALFFLYFMSWSAGAMSTESYLILAFWSILGFVYFRFVFSKDEKRRFGKSTIVWIGLLFLIFFTSLMWVKQATDEMTKNVVENISEYYKEQNPNTDPDVLKDTGEYVESQLAEVDRVLTRNSIIQMALIMASLGIMFSIYTTISKREKQMETEKIKAEEGNRAKSVFLSNMSHDIRTPMNAIIGYINLAEGEGITFEEMKTYLSKIKGSSQHLLALINDILEMSRIESGKMQLDPVACDLKEIIGEVEDLFATQMSEKEIDFVVDVSGIKNGKVYCDKILLNRVLLNLVSNAYKFTPMKGKVSVAAFEKADEEGAHGEYEIRVSDSGIGMSKEFAAKVFEAFERERTSTVSKIQGTGLGMPITKNIIDLMDGSISVETEQGRGTEFTVKLKLELQEEDSKELDKAAEQELREKHHLTVDFSRKRLLLVEDMPINREIATMQLKGFGFTVDTVENGKEGVDALASSKPGYYDAVLMDIQMPVMDGYEATRAIRALPDEKLANTPVIAMTANAFAEDVKKAKESGMNGHIAKPIDVNRMIDVLRDVLINNE